MTGEITLTGKVTAIGGLKEKLLAASRMGFTRVIIPKSNAKDIKEFESELDKSLELIYAESMDEVLLNALEPARINHEITKNIKSKKHKSKKKFS